MVCYLKFNYSFGCFLRVKILILFKINKESRHFPRGVRLKVIEEERMQLKGIIQRKYLKTILSWKRLEQEKE